MSTENPSSTQAPAPRPRRSVGVPALVLAILATALASGGGGWLLARRAARDHVREGAMGAVAAKEQWQCPMHPSIVQDHPGNCPICGMKLVEVAATGGPAAPAQASAEQRAQWQCPMHPSIVQDHPGNCPICGMKLVEVAATGGPAAPAQASAEQRAQWQCPMHPSIVQDHPGNCPICGMKLVKISGAEGEGGGGPAPQGLATVTIDPARQQLIGLKVAHAEVGRVGGAWRTSGRVAVDETRVHHVNVKFSGFMEHVYANFVGRPVKRGEPLFSIYSPELLAAQEEYLLALETRRRLGPGAMSGDGDALVAAARRKLELWDVPASEIERLERTGRPSRTVTFHSPATGVLTKKDVVPGMRVNAGEMPFEIVDLSRVWVLADAYESELGRVRIGMTARLSLKAFPNRTFQGRVAFMDPLLDPKTRTAKVRIEVPNPTGELRPEMFGEVVLEGKSRQGVRIPADAVIHSGTKAVVFVALGQGKFQPREVQLGDGDSEYVEVISGLEAGEGVVTRANFLVDSESRLRASLAALSAGAETVPAAGHEGHGAPAPATPPAGGASADPHAGHRR